ncbi:hypothetical protein BACCIP111899_02379 [Bacillus rhizoplanae]|uniref:Uncharacterized protein n=1 Tax=Bacillus rhizoplanae TaxID=2880966 RepID=A0ABN7ZW69_9BACI|nr:hypothetical protein [Bacillus rhizoplanae]CAG9613184.1 hypothetical protein BACCIP111899_02379 [Bacillus rhizoplanae]
MYPKTEHTFRFIPIILVINNLFKFQVTTMASNPEVVVLVQVRMVITYISFINSRKQKRIERKHAKAAGFIQLLIFHFLQMAFLINSSVMT